MTFLNITEERSAYSVKKWQFFMAFWAETYSLLAAQNHYEPGGQELLAFDKAIEGNRRSPHPGIPNDGGGRDTEQES